MVRLDIFTAPIGARVYIDSVDTLKATPATFDVSIGAHSYLLQLEQYTDIYGVFQADAGYDYIINATFQKITDIEQTKYAKQYAQVGWITLGVAIIGGVISFIIYNRSK